MGFSNERRMNTTTDANVQGTTAPQILQEAARNEAKWDWKQIKGLIFAYGRVKTVNAILSWRHGGPCDTDDGIAYFDLMLPYCVEIAHLDPEARFDLAMRRFRHWMPRVVAELGEVGIGQQWDALAETRSIAESMRRVTSETGNVQWLPTAAKIRDDLRLTHAERAGINKLYDKQIIRGIGVIDPPSAEERRALKTERMTASRRAAGVTPQSERTSTAEAEHLGGLVGCTGRTIRSHIAKGTLDTFLAKRGFIRSVPTPILDGMDESPSMITPEVDRLQIFREMLSDTYCEDWHDRAMV